jgi:serine/threonine protein kinase
MRAMFGSTYTLLEKIGQGGMGIVHRARDEKTGQVVALKVMTAEAASSPLLRLRFEQEFLTAGRLRHPSIVRALACDLHGPQPYFVMELVEGQSLRERIVQNGPLPQEEALPIILQVADGLAQAHELNLVHRDIKPDNILLTADGQARLIDLGLVKDLRVDRHLTGTGTGLGTFGYVAPEQADDAKRADPRSDIYSLAATLYHALTGVPPFQERVRLVLMAKQLRNQFVPPRCLAPTIHPGVDEAICRALDGRPDKRQQSCREFVTSLPQTCPPADGAHSPRPQVGWAEPGHAALRQVSGRRLAQRFPCNASITCGTGWNSRDRFGGRLQDISLSGVRLLLPRRFEPGAILTGEIADHQQESTLRVLARVCWVQGRGEGQWDLGCAFHREIGPDELHMLLGSPAPTVVISGATP